MKKIILLILIIGSVQYANCQQRAQFSQYMNNNYALNPAAGGTEDYADIKASFRTQWVGMDGGPVTYYLSGHTPIGKMGGKPHPRNKSRSHHVIGGFAYRDITGPSSRLGISGSYSYNMQITETIRASAGTFVGFQQYSINGNKLQFHDPGDNSVIQKITVPDLSLGFWMYSNTVFLGLTVAQALQNNLNFGFTDAQHSKLTNHYFLTGGVRIPINPDWSIIPSAMVKYASPAQPSVDVNAKLKYKDLFWMGASYRNLDSFIGLAGVTINNMIDISYSYDATVSALSKYNSGSHEILVGVRLKQKGRVICPSNFW